MQLELFADAADELLKRSYDFGVITARKRQRISLQKGAEEERVLRDESAEPVCRQRAIVKSLYERMGQAGLRQLEA